MTEKLLVTSALPYANGPLHMGHLAGAYLPADIYVRYKRLTGADVIYICGSDEHGVPITIRADTEGVSPRHIVDRYHAMLKEAFNALAFSFDNYSRTSLPLHAELSQEFFLKAHERGYITKHTTEQLYCPHCKRFLPDRYVEGTCPVCGKAGARGDQCEHCGNWYDAVKLTDPHCKICGETPEVRKTTHWYLDLRKFQKPLEAYLKSRKDWKENVVNFCSKMLERGLEERPITRDLDWGVPVPLPEGEGKVFYVWFDAPIGYISSTREWAEGKGKPDLWKEYWTDAERKLVHFIGKDNIVFHTIVWPAVLMAQWERLPQKEKDFEKELKGAYNLPYHIPANEFLNIQGRKLSTSQNWAIWAHEVVKTFDADFVRYYLSCILPETQDSNWDWDEFMVRINQELVDILGNLINRTLTFVDKYFDGKIPQRGEPGELDSWMLERMAKAPRLIGESLDHFRIREGLHRMMDLARAGNKFYNDKEPWRTRTEDPADCATTMNITCSVIAELCVVASPYLPFLAERTARILGLGEEIAKLGWEEAGHFAVPPGTELGEVSMPFSKVEPEQVEEQKARLGKPPQENQREKAQDKRLKITKEKKVSGKETIPYEDFAKLDLRVATVKACEKVAGTDKLLKVTLSDGEGERTVVAGMAESYTPEEMTGKKVVLLANLEPRPMRGIVSEGMILAGSATIDGKEKIVLLTLDGDKPELPDGSDVD